MNRLQSEATRMATLPLTEPELRALAKTLKRLGIEVVVPDETESRRLRKLCDRIALASWDQSKELSRQT